MTDSARPNVSELRGEPIDAVLPPPQLARFRVVTGVDLDEHLQVFVHGWHKLAVVAGDRVFLFPRHAAHVDGLQRELTAYRVLGDAGIPLVPRLLGEWDDDTVHPYAFAAVSRLPGDHDDDPVGLFDELASAIATWHELPPPAELADARPPPEHEVRPHLRWFHRALDPTTSAVAVDELVDHLGGDASHQRDTWVDALGTAARHPHVLVHGDIHEDQLLSVAGVLTGIIDWETARIDHPFFDFDYGEWGTGLWRRHGHELDDLWRRQWTAYARARGLDLSAEPLVTAFHLRQLALDTDFT